MEKPGKMLRGNHSQERGHPNHQTTLVCPFQLFHFPRHPGSQPARPSPVLPSTNIFGVFTSSALAGWPGFLGRTTDGTGAPIFPARTTGLDGSHSDCNQKNHQQALYRLQHCTEPELDRGRMGSETEDQKHKVPQTVIDTESVPVACPTSRFLSSSPLSTCNFLSHLSPSTGSFLLLHPPMLQVFAPAAPLATHSLSCATHTSV